MNAQSGIPTRDLLYTDPMQYHLSYTDTWAMCQNHLDWSQIIEPVNIERRQHHREFLRLVI